MSTVKCFNTGRGALHVIWQLSKSELSQAGGLGVTCNPHRVFVNPISTEGGILCPPHYYVPPGFSDPESYSNT